MEVSARAVSAKSATAVRRVAANFREKATNGRVVSWSARGQNRWRNFALPRGVFPRGESKWRVGRWSPWKGVWLRLAALANERLGAFPSRTRQKSFL